MTASVSVLHLNDIVMNGRVAAFPATATVVRLKGAWLNNIHPVSREKSNTNTHTYTHRRSKSPHVMICKGRQRY